MAYLSQSTISRLQKQLATIEGQIDTANESMNKVLANDIQSFSFNSGEGSQSSTRWSVSQYESIISKLEKKAESIRQRLSGLGVTSLSVRRRDEM